jgi:4-amino-4-deoxy-L-arabinose transferase-like glycosyltransferase
MLIASHWRATASRWLDRHPWLILAGLVALAALLRFPDLASRGQWDSDQGHDMLVLRAFVRDGQVPLLGPPTSIGDFHHGVLYYHLLAPAAAVTGGDSPLAILATIALANVVAVAVVWWLGGAIGGPLAGAVAGLAMALSPSAIEESTFIWNPNLIALSSSIALAAAWLAWTRRRARWWIVVGLGATVTMHLHVLGAVLLLPLAVAFVADVRRTGPGHRRPFAIAGLAVVLILVVAYVPVGIHELSHDFAETRAAASFLTGGGPADPGPSLPVRMVFIALRVVAWPLIGLVTNAPVAALIAAMGVVVLLAGLGLDAPGPRRSAARWGAATLVWSVLALSVGARSLATVVPGLPNDHYHAFLDPIVFLVTGVGVAGLARRGMAGAAAALVIVVGLSAFQVAARPGPVSPDGGWTAAEAAGARIVAELDDRPAALLGLPDLKPTDAYGYPLIRAGWPPVAIEDADALVVLCDRLFETAIGAPCDGPAEALAVASHPEFGLLTSRFPASPRTVISIYLRLASAPGAP